MHTRLTTTIRKSALPGMIGLLLAQAASADTALTVTSLADSGPGTLREVLSSTKEENDNRFYISFAGALNCTATTPCTIGLLSPLSYYAESIIIDGPGSDALTIDSSANPEANALVASRSNTDIPLEFGLSGVKISGTKADIYDWNTAIRTDGIDTLTFTDVWFDHNDSESLVVIDGKEVTLDRCIFTNNGRGASIGANRIVVTDSVFNFNAVDSLHLSDFDAATIDRSAFYQNETGIAIHATLPDSVAEITNSTLAGSTDTAIAIFFTGSSVPSEARLSHSSVLDNTGIDVGGVRVGGYSGTLVLVDNLIGDNACTEEECFDDNVCSKGGESCSPDLRLVNSDADRLTTIESLGYNLIEAPGTAVVAQSSDITGQTPAANCDEPNSNSPTAAVVCTPSSSSPALNKIPIVNGSCNATGVTIDQLGTARPQGTKCDMGAIEVKMRNSRR